MKYRFLGAAMVSVATSSSTVVAQEPLEFGKDVFLAQCVACHAIACNRSGPKLGELFGRRAGSVADFPDYSDGIKRSNIVWTEETLDTFLKDPGAMIPGTAMVLAGRLDDAYQRHSLITYLKSGDTSLDLCF